MYKDFEGKTKKEALDLASEELGIATDNLDVEVLESSKGIFKRGLVKVRVYFDNAVATVDKLDTADKFEDELIGFLKNLAEKMGYNADAYISAREDGKINIGIDTEYSNILIGKNGKNLDAIQLLVNVFSSKLGRKDLKVIVDIEHYRKRREEKIVDVAIKAAKSVRKTRGTRLLEYMNPFERRIVHTTLNNEKDIETVSEGEGVYKQVRVLYKG
ncbi:MAG: protein jag [Spirochaetales bacterium]|nr:protein jag [Spirochaetales bacterium]